MQGGQFLYVSTVLADGFWTLETQVNLDGFSATRAYCSCVQVTVLSVK